MRILTCNIRTSTADDGENHWEYRKEYCCEVIEAHSPDIVCFQEMKRDQFVHVQSYFRPFKSYGIPDVPAGQNPVNAIFYRSDCFQFITDSVCGNYPSDHYFVSADVVGA